MLPPNPMLYWQIRRSMGIPLTEDEKKAEDESLKLTLHILWLFPRLVIGSMIGGLILAILIIVFG